MHRLMSLYNQNRRLFWVIILAIIIIGFLAWRLIGVATQNTNYNQYREDVNINTNNFNSLVVSDQKSVLSGENANLDESEISIIDKFISYCNSGKTTEAYNLVSKECKEEMYPNLKNFEELYYKPVFGKGAKNASIENWANDIYKVTLKEDALSTGKISSENDLQDYISLTKDNEGNTKLNINSYIGRETYDKTDEDDYLKIKLQRVDSYMDYEIYTFEVQNKSEKTIALGDIQNSEMSYLEDENGLKYNANNTELTQERITLTQKQTKFVQIKYFNRFSSTRKIKKLIFEKIILNYDAYVSLGNNYTYSYDYPEMEIDL